MSEEEESQITPEERKQGEEEEARSRQTYDPQNKSVNLNKRRVTDMRGNRKVTLPKALSAKSEALIEVRNESYRSIFNDYVETNCDSKGRQTVNLTEEEKDGLKTLE